MEKRKRFRELLKQDGVIVTPGCHDALGARMIEAAGFEALSISGYGVAASLLGKPDIELVTMTEIVGVARRIASAVDIPVICDADTGYGGINNVIRTVEEFEAAGVTAIHIEDQVSPKRCGLQAGVRVVSLEDYLVKLRAALQARKDKNFLIIARTDSLKVYGMEEAIRRAKAFVETGADAIFLEGVHTIEELKTVKAALPDIPLLNIIQENADYPYLTVKEAEELGYKILMYPITGTCIFVKEVMKMLNTLKKTGSTKEYMHDMLASIEDFEKLVGLPQIREREARLEDDNKLYTTKNNL